MRKRLGEECWVGLRPFRSDIRLELEMVNGKPVIHNYGHGGSGVTTFWGCAKDVLTLFQNIPNTQPVKSHL